MTVAMILWRVSTWAPKVYAEDVMPFAQLLQSLRQKDRVLKALKRSIMYTDFSGKSIVFIGFFLITYLFLFTYYLFFAQVEGGCRPARCDPQRRGENYDFYRCTGKDR